MTLGALKINTTRTKSDRIPQLKGRGLHRSERAEIMGPVDLERGRKHVPTDQTKAGIAEPERGGGMRMKAQRKQLS